MARVQPPLADLLHCTRCALIHCVQEVMHTGTHPEVGGGGGGVRAAQT